MENVSIHAAAMKAIEWFNLDPEAMSAESRPRKPEVTRQRTATRTGTEASRKSRHRWRRKARPTSLEIPVGQAGAQHPYLAERGLTLETIVDFGVGFCAKGMMADRIAIPIHNAEGEVVAYAGRFPGEPPDEDTPKYKLPQGFRKSLELFNIDRAIKEPADKPLVIVEGFFDCMKLHQFGCRKVVALMGSTMSAAQEELIRRHTDSNSHVIVMLDEDEAGKAGREDIAVPAGEVCLRDGSRLRQGRTAAGEHDRRGSEANAWRRIVSATAIPSAKFRLGKIVSTPNALAHLSQDRHLAWYSTASSR